MKQEGIGEVVFAGTADPFVAMTVGTVTGRCALLLDRGEAFTLRDELQVALARAFPGWRDASTGMTAPKTTPDPEDDALIELMARAAFEGDDRARVAAGLHPSSWDELPHRYRDTWRANQRAAVRALVAYVTDKPSS